MPSETEAAPKEWRAASTRTSPSATPAAASAAPSPARTTSGSRALTMNTNPMHFDEPYAARTRFEQPLVNSAFTLAVVTGLTVPTRARTPRNLEWTDIKLPKPVFEGDTLHARSEILDVRESSSNPSVGIVSMRCRGINQRGGEVVIEFRRTFMVYRRGAPEVADRFPHTDTEWTV